MKVAIVCDWLTNFSGAEQVMESICELYPEADIYTPIYNKEKVTQFTSHSIHTSFLQKWPTAQKSWQKYILFMPSACESFDLDAYDLVISSSHTGCSKGAITRADATHISYCHSPMRTVWDNYHEYIRHSSWPGFLKKLIPGMLHKLRMWDYCAAQRVDHFIGNSTFIQQRIAKYYGRESAVIHPPVDIERFVLGEKEESDDYYLIVGRLVPNKNVEMAVRAFVGSGKKLKIAGNGPLKAHLEAISDENIELLGFVDDEALLELIQNCKALIYPQVEDFGISAVEAMACGRPVIGYKAGGVLDTIKEGVSGVYFNEYTSDSLRNCIENFEKKSHSWERNSIRKWALQFSNSRFKQEFSDFVREKMKLN